MKCDALRSGRLTWAPLFIACVPLVCGAQDGQEDPKQLDRVVVTGDERGGELDTIEIGRVITSDEISRYSDTSVGAVLRRQPGVIVEGYSASSANRVRLRGLGGGYVRVLVNGMPSNLPLDEISTNEVDRIIISSAPSPELSGAAIAGVINVILRRPVGKPETKVEASVSDVYGKTSGAASFSAKRSTRDFDYSLMANGRVFEGIDHYENGFVNVEDSVVMTMRDLLQSNLDRGYSASIGGGVVFDVFGGTIRANIRHSQTDFESEGFDRSFYHIGSDPGYTTDTYVSDGDVSSDMFDASFTRDVSDRLERKITLLLNRRSSRRTSDVFYSFPEAVRNTLAKSSERGLRLQLDDDLEVRANGKISYGAVFGASSVRTGRWDSLPGSDIYSSSRGGDLRTAALYVKHQDENGGLAYSYGARLESIADEREPAADASYLVPLPSAQLRWKLSANSSVKFGVNSAYKLPSTNQRMAIRSISINNSFFEPDSVGNPYLELEESRGLDAGYNFERSGVSYSVSAFYRDIDNPIISIREVVDGRWVDHPVNFPGARVYGLDSEYRVTLNRKGSTRNFGVSLGLYRSFVDGVDRSDNRLDSQPTMSVGLNYDFQSKSSPFGIGASYKYVENGVVAVSNTQTVWQSDQRLLEAYLSYTTKNGLLFKLTGSNLLEPVANSENRFEEDGHSSIRSTRHPSYRDVRLSLERKW